MRNTPIGQYEQLGCQGYSMRGIRRSCANATPVVVVSFSAVAC